MIEVINDLLHKKNQNPLLPTDMSPNVAISRFSRTFVNKFVYKNTICCRVQVVQPVTTADIHLMSVTDTEKCLAVTSTNVSVG